MTLKKIALTFTFLLLSLSAVCETDWACQYTEKYPEICFLANQEVRKTEEGNQVEQNSYSKVLFGKQFIEFDRTLMTLRCLHRIIEGKYESFTADQPEQIKLSLDSFQELHTQALVIIESGWRGLSKEELIQTLEAALVLGDLGKSEQAREHFRTFGASAVDHDDFHEEMIAALQSYPELSPTFDKLPPAAKQLITTSANLAHYGHITHLEGGKGMFSKLIRHLQKEETLFFFEFDLLVHTCDVAGAQGHINQRSSLTYTEPAHRALQWVRHVCQKAQSDEEAFNRYLKLRAEQLGLSIDTPTERVLTRLGAMLRLNQQSNGQVLERAFTSLSPETRAAVISQLDPEQGNEPDLTATYMPAMLINLANHQQLGDSSEERMVQAVRRGAPFLAKVRRAGRDAKICLCFNQVAGVAKRIPFAIDSSAEFKIDSEGNVLLFLEELSIFS